MGVECLSVVFMHTQHLSVLLNVMICCCCQESSDVCVFSLSFPFFLYIFFKRVKAVKSQGVFVFLVIPGVGAHDRKTTCIIEGQGE